jgi:hypothetical protein
LSLMVRYDHPTQSVLPSLQDRFNYRERMYWLCHHGTGPIASPIIPSHPNPDPRPARMQTVTASWTSTTPWTILTPTPRTIHRRSLIFLPGTILIPTPMAMNCQPIRTNQARSSRQKRERRREPSPDTPGIPNRGKSGPGYPVCAPGKCHPEDHALCLRFKE